MKILIVRFRQLGDAVLSTPLFNTLHATFPEASIDLVLNDRIAPLLAGHPAIRRIHAFSEAERHNMARYLPRVWQIVHREHYDVIIDQFTTFYSQLFALFSPSTRYRIAVDKWYSRLMSNYTLPKCGRGSMVDHNINMAAPLEAIRPLQRDRHISLSITARELESMRSYLEGCGLDLSRPIILMGVTAKLSSKTWAEDRMAWVIDRFTGRYPDAQIIFNYAPGAEETNARRIYNRLADGRNVFIDVQTRSPRELFALAHFICFYFGNEGGAPHCACSGKAVAGDLRPQLLEIHLDSTGRSTGRGRLGRRLRADRRLAAGPALRHDYQGRGVATTRKSIQPSASKRL